MSFRKFTEYGAASRTNVTIRTNDLLFISKNILKQFNSENSEYAVIYIDDKNCLVGIKFFEDKPPNGDYRKLSKEKSGVSVNIAPVLRYLGIKKLHEKFTTGTQEKEGLLVFSLHNLKESQLHLPV